LWRQQIQDWLIAACQNAKTLVRAFHPGRRAGENRVGAGVPRIAISIRRVLCLLAVKITRLLAPGTLPSYQLR
jgi:hypothetical protein